MKDVNVILGDWHALKSKEEVSKILDAEIDRFSNFMATIGDWKAAGPLSAPERTLIKTYLVHKLNGKLDKET
ncbi:MAG: hypothetical protein E6R04_00635 [Spirochaetes bacterium]|jgi:hypothetical protein|nr:MAG: hypothetical protein E6R04_00635 [Spirochaetota bacterium]